MLTRFQQLDSFDELREYINATLCDHNHLQPDAFPMTEKLLYRGKRPCGVYFCLHGPRAVKFTAIWEIDRNQILFYDANGERFQKTQLAAALTLEPVLA